MVLAVYVETTAGTETREELRDGTFTETRIVGSRIG